MTRTELLRAQALMRAGIQPDVQTVARLLELALVTRGLLGFRHVTGCGFGRGEQCECPGPWAKHACIGYETGTGKRAPTGRFNVARQHIDNTWEHSDNGDFTEPQADAIVERLNRAADR